MIYLDNAASTAVSEEVVAEMLPYLAIEYGNPSSLHRYGRRADRAVRLGRRQVAGAIGASPSEILITSGATESNNTAIGGIAEIHPGGHIVTSAIEHEAVLEPCSRLKERGFSVSYVRVDGSGIVDPGDVRDAITDRTFLVSIMLANNEVGTVQPVREISRICRESGVALHTDAVQAVGKIPVDVDRLGVDMLSISSHKINGPKGVGALYIRDGMRIRPMILGGGQEAGMRSGTENVAGVVGFGKACQLARDSMEERSGHMTRLRDLLVEMVLDGIPHTTYNGDARRRLPGNAHFTFLGVNGEDLIIKLDEEGIAASTGSACSIRTQKASHVLRAMGFDHEHVTGSLRLTVGVSNTREEIVQTVHILKRVVEQLRAVSPFKEKYGFGRSAAG